MYITINSLKKNLGKYIEMEDLYIGFPFLLIFLILFSALPNKTIPFIFLTIGILLMLPVRVSKKNRMYKVFYLLFLYLKRRRTFIYLKEEEGDIKDGNKQPEARGKKKRKGTKTS